MKTFKTFLIAATMLAVSGSASAAITKGADGFYSIGSAADMAEFATIAATDHSACARLTASFIMATTPWTGLTEYAGTFDGNGNTIRRMVAPLCLTTSGGAVIKNLMLQGSLTSTQANFGAFVCNHTGGSLTIENCTNSTSITSDYDRTGGFIGNVAAGTVTMTDCTNSSSITSTKGNVAGLVGDASSTSTTLTNCFNSGAIECTGSLAQVAGLVGTCRAAANATIKFSHCTNRGTITGKANGSGNSNMAGLLGWLSSTSGKTATIEYCANTAAITGTGNNIAALLGQA